jgi:hypothetical protein
MAAILEIPEVLQRISGSPSRSTTGSTNSMNMAAGPS